MPQAPVGPWPRSPLRLAPSEAQAEPGDLHAEIMGDALCIPQPLAAEATQRGLRNAADLVAYATTFPSALAKHLNWSVPEVQAAAAKLTAQLAEHDPAFRTLAMQRPEPAYGALNPDDLPA